MKKLIAAIYVKDEMAYEDKELTRPVEKDLSVRELATRYYENGADAIVYLDASYDDASHEKSIQNLRRICKEVDIPVYAGGSIHRVEDVKKYLYAGAGCALLDASLESNLAIMTEATNRFGAEKVGILLSKESPDGLSLIEVNQTKEILILGNTGSYGYQGEASYLSDTLDLALLGADNTKGLGTLAMTNPAFDYMAKKQELQALGIPVHIFESSVDFSNFKLNEDGLIPVIVQDYATDEVLMLAYMNQESYELTLKTGKMTYYSRSRQEIWVKGLTSDHYQYVISLKLDCDHDTILAKVRQVGAACHTGAHSCFFQDLASREMHKTNPLKVLNEVMSVIKDRQVNPKEGSYTNYLFDKGIDKILKKVGEEATEIIIAAKNPEPVESKYEIADFLYHVMVLMAVKGLDWEEIMEELANR